MQRRIVVLAAGAVGRGRGRRAWCTRLAGYPPSFWAPPPAALRPSHIYGWMDGWAPQNAPLEHYLADPRQSLHKQALTEGGTLANAPNMVRRCMFMKFHTLDPLHSNS